LGGKSGRPLRRSRQPCGPASGPHGAGSTTGSSGECSGVGGAVGPGRRPGCRAGDGPWWVARRTREAAARRLAREASARSTGCRTSGERCASRAVRRSAAAAARQSRLLTGFSARRAFGTLKGTIRSGVWSMVADIARTCLPTAARGRRPGVVTRRERHRRGGRCAKYSRCAHATPPGRRTDPGEAPVPNAAHHACDE
jgi:hypothetical protein